MPPRTSASAARRAQRFHELKRDLDQLEYFCKGTVLKRMMKCGKAACACHSDPAKAEPLTGYKIALGWSLFWSAPRTSSTPPWCTVE